jgi:hypothetical protein
MHKREGTVEFRDSGDIQRAIYIMERNKKRLLEEKRLEIAEKRKRKQLNKPTFGSCMSMELVSAQHIPLKDHLEIEAFNHHEDVDLESFNVETATTFENQALQEVEKIASTTLDTEANIKQYTIDKALQAIDDSSVIYSDSSCSSSDEMNDEDFDPELEDQIDYEDEDDEESEDPEKTFWKRKSTN